MSAYCYSNLLTYMSQSMMMIGALCRKQVEQTAAYRMPACLEILLLVLADGRRTTNDISRIIVRCRSHSSDVFPR